MYIFIEKMIEQMWKMFNMWKIWVEGVMRLLQIFFFSGNFEII